MFTKINNAVSLISLVYGMLLLCLSIFSWGFVDASVPIVAPTWLFVLVHEHRSLSAFIYIGLTALFFVWYCYLLVRAARKNIGILEVKIYITLTCIVLFFSFPGFSYDIFNYIATAKVTFLYGENPYLVMPIDIVNEPMLSYMHASNKAALYGPLWIALTSIPHILGGGNIFFAIFAMKAFMLLFYLLSLVLVWKLSEKRVWSLVFFGLNPLVLMETLISAHNDIVMMCLALVVFYCLRQKHIFLGGICLFFSIFIKYATLVLAPIFIYVAWSIYTKRAVKWKSVWFWSACALFGIFLLSTFREEIYAWYYIWPLAFVSLLPNSSLAAILSIGFSFGLLQRFTPYIFTREWGGLTPLIKTLVTFGFPALSLIFYGVKKRL